MPLNPVEFHQELERRTLEEKEKMDQFKMQEEKMKAYRDQKRNGKPPMPLPASADGQ